MMLRYTAARPMISLLPILLGISLIILLLIPMSGSFAQEDAPPGFTDFQETGAQSGPLSPSSAPTYSHSRLEANAAFYDNRAVFDSVWPGLPSENFEASLVPPASVLNCFGTISSLTDDACFALGSILPGLVISPTGDDYVVATDGFLGVTSTVVGPNTFTDNTHVFLDPPVNAVGLDILDPIGVSTFTIDVYGSGSVYLGSGTVGSVGLTPVFWGVSSNSTPIAELFITGTGNGAELLDNISFGDSSYVTHDCNDPRNPFVNCSFETGDFFGWVSTDLPTPFYPQTVTGTLAQTWPDFFYTNPTDGDFAVLNGFDGITGTIQLAQDVYLPPGSTELLFDYRAAWDLFSFGAVIDRHFSVEVQPSGGGAPLQSTTLLTATAGTLITDTGNLAGAVDVSAFAGTDVRINFLWNIPEEFTGPAQFQLDNVLVGIFPPDIDVDPASMSPTQVPGTVSVHSLTIYNLGESVLNWNILEGSRPPESNLGPVALPDNRVEYLNSGSGDSSFDCKAFENFPGAEPNGYAEACLSVNPAPEIYPDLPEGPTDTGFAQDIGFVSDNFVSFTLNDFPNQTVVATSTLAIFGMDFDEYANTLYGIDNSSATFGTIDQSTAVFSTIGPLNGLAFHIWTGLSVDPTDGTIYASSTDGVTSTLYTVNPVTGAATEVGGTTDASLLIDISVGPNGQMYGHDIGTDSIYLIDKTTGSVTLLGPTGYNANFAQGMDFDNEDGTLYIFLYQGGGANIYGTVDLFSGAVTPLAVDNPLGEWEGATQTVSHCDPTNIPWVSVSPTAGSTPAGGNTVLDVTFDSTGLATETYTGNLCVLSNDPDTPLIIVPLTLDVVPPNLNLPVIVRNWP